VAVALVGCGWFDAPALQVTPTSLIGMTSPQTTLTVRNAGGGSLAWSVASSSPRVVVTPTSGDLFAGGSRTLVVTVDATGLDKGESVTASLSFTSSGGNATVDVTYPIVSGIGTCAGFTPIERAMATPPAAAGVSARPVGNEILVAYAGSFGVNAQDAATATADLRAQVTGAHALSLLRAGAGGSPDLLRAPQGADVDALVATLQADPRVRYAQRNYYLEKAFVPNDPSFGEQWNLSSFGLPEAWDVERGDGPGDAVVIAVLDSGVQTTHPDLAAKVLPGYDFFDLDADPNPGPPNGENEHGTHVAGIAAAIGDDATGVAGVAFGPRIRVLPVKVFDDTGLQGTVAGLVDAIRWSAGLSVTGAPANANKAHVINMSVGVPGRFPALDAAAEEAWNAGVFLVAAAGNHGNGVTDAGVLSPGNAPCVVAVASVDETYVVSSFSNTGPEVEVAAPAGVGSATCGAVYSTIPLSTYGCMAGTSMASPFVAGVAGLLFAQGTYDTPAAVRSRLSQTTEVDAWMTDAQEYGNGVVCADAALGAATRCGLPLP
jgi:serine protease